MLNMFQKILIIICQSAVLSISLFKLIFAFLTSALFIHGSCAVLARLPYYFRNALIKSKNPPDGGLKKATN